MKEKEFLYVGYYIDTDNHYILKVGTTNNLDRRKQEHTRNYRKAKEHTLPQNKEFVYIWHLPLSKYNTLRYEDKTKEKWKNAGLGDYVRNDRFVLEKIPKEIEITIRKTYKIALPQSNLFLCQITKKSI